MTDQPTEPESGGAPQAGADSLFHLGESAGLFPSPDDEPEEFPDDAIWIADDDFAAAASQAPPPVRVPGPGLPESIGWMAGVMGLQLAAGLFMLAAIVLVELPAGRMPTRAFLNRVREDNIVGLFAGVQAISVVGIGLAAYLRLGRERARMLPLTPIPWQQLVIIFVAVLPMVALASQLHVAAAAGWDWFTNLIGVPRMDELSSMTAVKELAQGTPMWVLLLMIAVAPAIAEELVFRGIIGRGLVARWGLPAGIAITTVMFAAMHVHPPHVFALLPLSVHMHLIYQSSRSFFAPMLVHFLNNGFSVVMLKWAMENEAAKNVAQVDDPAFSFVIFLGSAVSVVTLLMLTWKTRVEFRYEDGTEWDPGYPAVERPPAEEGLIGECRPAGVAPWLMAGTGLGLFFLCVVLYGVADYYGWRI